MIEALANLFLAPDLGLNLQLELRTIVPIYGLPCKARAEEVRHLRPILPGYIQLVLDRIRVHYVR